MPDKRQMIRPVRVFLASPGDVAEERGIAACLLDALQSGPVWRDKLKFDTVLWEQPGSGAPILAHLTPQEAIVQGRPKPSECDIVIVIFWSRMGTPLPAEFALKGDGSRYESGSEWEFWDAVQAAEQNNGHPRVLLYRRDEEPQIGFRDSDRDVKLAQWDKVEQFFKGLSDADGVIQYGHTAYQLDGFEDQLRADLEATLPGVLAGALEGQATEAHQAKPDTSVIKPLPTVFSELWQQVINNPGDDATVGLSLDLEAAQLRDIRHFPFQDSRQYRLARIAEWSQPLYQLDKRFTALTLMLYQQEEGFVAQKPGEITDLRQLFDRQPDVTAFVVLGAPGAGKSTLLRRLEMDLACDALRAGESKADLHESGSEPYLSFYLSLNSYQSKAGAEALTPQGWLEQNWALAYPGLPVLTEYLQNQRVVLLLDALNEMPHRNFEEFQERVAAWRQLIEDFAQVYRHCRFVFSCRTLDYSSTLSSETLAVPHVRIERLGEEQIRAFLQCYAEEQADELFAEIKRQGQLDLYSTPYFLKLLIEQARRSGRVPQGRAALFTGFVREVLGREYKKSNPLVLRKGLLSERELKKLALQVDNPAEWGGDCNLPEQGALFRELARLAYTMQERGIHDETAQVSVDYGEALDCVDCAEAETLLEVGVALGILDEDRRRERIQFMHQLLQEYFAARRLAANPEPERVRSVWQADQASPSLEETLDKLADYEPLPPPRSTGWEETTVMAVAMSTEPDAYLRELTEVNLPLAGRAAAQAEVLASDEVKQDLREQLITRCQDSAADVRHRIAAGRALGELGDPRFVEKYGEYGRYLLPPTVVIPGGTYRIGSDEGIRDNEAPEHEVEIGEFRLGHFPVTNAEWSCFMEAGGYEDERWWQGEDALAWFRGEVIAGGPREQWRGHREYIQNNLEVIREWPKQGRLTSKQLEDYERYAAMSDEAFDELLANSFPSGKQHKPFHWNDSAYNHPQHPVVGICWFEAQAYCNWLSEQAGKAWRLPTEVQWEASARGRISVQGEAGRRYAWRGDFTPEHCNTFESHIRGTTPVGIFPQGRTLLQSNLGTFKSDGLKTNDTALNDMVGNVFEWTTTSYQNYPYESDDGRELDQMCGGIHRVLRGGSWDLNQEYARVAFRSWYLPSDRDNYAGFRLLLCVSPPSS